MASVVEIIFLGTGTSSSVPTVSCLTDPEKSCPVCLSSQTPEGRKNNRRNTSMIVRFRKHDDPPEFRLRYVVTYKLSIHMWCLYNTYRNVLIDCGKTFYSIVLDWLLRPNFVIDTFSSSQRYRNPSKVRHSRVGWCDYYTWPCWCLLRYGWFTRMDTWWHYSAPYWRSSVTWSDGGHW